MRQSGILMHITSLPGPYGVGTMGKQAHAFVDFLKKAGQSCWQILPLTPTGFGDSPYQSCSTFAGNHYLIDLDLLVEEGLLREEEIRDIPWCHTDDRVDFGLLYQSRLKVLRIAYSRFAGGEAFDSFCRENSSWLSDFSLFMALKDQNGGKPWYQWAAPLKHREAEAVWQARRDLKEQIRFYQFVQYLFDRQWQQLRSYAQEAGVRIIGDVPIYVPLDSVDVWSSPELFLLDEDLNPIAVAGCPPDAFSEDGQLWGNPLYRWERHEKDGFAWWVRRMAAAGSRYDVVRIDHFRGLESYWAVPYGDATARGGRWVKGPDMNFIRALQEKLPSIEMIAEDLGVITPEVRQLRDASGYPGMKVLEFAFDSRDDSEYLPHRYTQNTVCYTGTHDNMTMTQWFRETNADTVAYAKAYMALSDGDNLTWGAIRTVMASVSDLCIIQMQDYLELGGEARMNFPGTQGGNWTWRAAEDCMRPALAERICQMTRLYGRAKQTTVI